MKDRVPENPGRVLITPENGGSAYYATITRADNPTQNGTPLNKSSLLKDATAALFGLDADAVPDDVLVIIKTLIASNKALANSKAQIASGSYTGTGTLGSSKPNILSFGFAPKFVFVYAKTDVNYYGNEYGNFNKFFVWGVGLTKGTAYYKSGSSAAINFTATNDGLKWYITTAGGTTYSKAMYQLNDSGVAYGYVAIG